jgi:Tfp pilus assembly protein PilN
MRAVNLLPRDESRAQVEGGRLALLIALGGLVGVTVLAGVVAMSSSKAASDTEAELQAVEAAIARVPKVATPVVSQDVLSQERTDRVTALATALSSRVAFDRLLRDVSRVLPEDAWLTSVTAASPSGEPATPGAAPEAGQGISISGATYTHVSVARVLSRLAVVPSLENVTLESSAIVAPEALTTSQSGEQAAKKPKGRRIVVFTVAATARTGGAS